MEAISWLTEHWTIESVGIIGGLLLSAYATYRDEKARRISNLIAITVQYRDIWKELYQRPALFRVLKKNVDLNASPVSEEEWLFVKLLVLHLDTVFQANDAGMLIKLDGAQKDIRDFFSAPIPSAVWARIKPFQNEAFVRFVEGALN